MKEQCSLSCKKLIEKHNNELAVWLTVEFDMKFDW